MKDPYEVLGVSSTATTDEIKSSYRSLVKMHHPDAGGDDQVMLDINAAWEILGDREKRIVHDRNRADNLQEMSQKDNLKPENYSRRHAAALDDELTEWFRVVYEPINKMLGEVINPLPRQLRDLSADPYDDYLMEKFCKYLESCDKKIKRVKNLFQSMPTPESVSDFGISVYHCLSEVEDGLTELEYYTHGYVDKYLHDGREMFREAKHLRANLHHERRRLEIV